MAEDVLRTRHAAVGRGTVPGDSGGCSVPSLGVAARDADGTEGWGVWGPLGVARAGGEHLGPPSEAKKPLFSFPPSKTFQYFKRRPILKPRSLRPPRGSVRSDHRFLSDTAFSKHAFPSPVSPPVLTHCLSSDFYAAAFQIHHDEFGSAVRACLWVPALKRGAIKWNRVSGSAGS